MAIVRALAMKPDLLLLDEITSALDPELVAEVLDVIRGLAEQGMTMIIATHEMGFARDIADRVCFLDQGQLLEEGPPADIFGSPQQARTRQFLDRVISAGRMGGAAAPESLPRCRVAGTRAEPVSGLASASRRISEPAGSKRLDEGHAEGVLAREHGGRQPVRLRLAIRA